MPCCPVLICSADLGLRSDDLSPLRSKSALEAKSRGSPRDEDEGHRVKVESGMRSESNFSVSDMRGWVQRKQHLNGLNTSKHMHTYQPLA